MPPGCRWRWWPRCWPAARPAGTDLGYRHAEVLLAVGGFVLAEAIRRLIEPSPVASGVMVIFGVVGLAN